jgi:CRISPR system Cascade subunit CasE
MFLHRLYLNTRNSDARRDLADPYAMHSTLCRAFVPPERPMPPGSVLWRRETPGSPLSTPVVLVQSGALPPDWSALLAAGWLAREPDPPLNIAERLGLERLRPGAVFRFRLRANPSKFVNRKRLGLLRRGDQEKWLCRVGQEIGGFSPKRERGGLDVGISEETMLKGRKRGEGAARISVFSALFEGFLTVEAPDLFARALSAGIGHGKAMGLGLLSVAPVSPASRG